MVRKEFFRSKLSLLSHAELTNYFNISGQNVGPDCSLKARVGIYFLRMATKSMSNKGMMKAMVSATKKSPADWKLIESTFGAGQFFDQGMQQVEVMHSVKPSVHIPSFEAVKIIATAKIHGSVCAKIRNVRP